MIPFSFTYKNEFTEPIEKNDIINQVAHYVGKNKGWNLVVT
ncbi:hypothetical protein FHS90_002881 [Rufibacter quisquiliarum]|uniref:Uncharacterized protein n=1 Tax=Rufibacter quisquiliarum TaxID=1549639 RepID=A0A839GTF5_9BACT|nr:hypothetical protein [Rufibacter quisquiliarum]